MDWTPELGTQSLVERLGHADALESLRLLLGGEVTGPTLVQAGWRATLRDIGDGHAVRLMADRSGTRLAYWPRVWAARSMAYLGDPSVAPLLFGAMDDENWRVRMTVIQTFGRLGLDGVTAQLLRALDDEHLRVRKAAVVALGRVGDEQALNPLLELVDDADDEWFSQVDRAIRSIEKRVNPTPGS